MLLNIIVIVLRETLEASILISVMLSVSHFHRLGTFWVYRALVAGFLGSVIYAVNLGAVSLWFDYMGQELLNALLQFVIYFLLIVVCSIQFCKATKAYVFLPYLMGLTIATAVVREGGELVLFYTGFIQGGASWLNAATSGFIGLAIGLSAGALSFYSLISFSQIQARKIHLVVLCLIAGGMVLQATQLLAQADWLSVGPAIWDSNWIVAEASVVGQLTYAVFGYEATPSLLELGIYIFSMVLMFCLVVMSQYLMGKRTKFVGN